MWKTNRMKPSDDADLLFTAINHHDILNYSTVLLVHHTLNIILKVVTYCPFHQTIAGPTRSPVGLGHTRLPVGGGTTAVNLFSLYSNASRFKPTLS